MEQKGVVSLDEEAKKLIEQLSALKAERDAVDIQIKTIQQTFVSYQDQLSEQGKDFASVIGESNDPYIRLLQEQLAKLEVQRDVTATQNPTLVGQELYSTKLKEIDAQIAALRGKLQSRMGRLLKTILPSAQEGPSVSGPADYLMRIKQKILETQIELQALEAKRKALDEPLREYETQFERLPAKTMQYARLQRDKQSVEKLFVVLEEKYNQASLMEHSEFGSVEIIDPAVPPAEPSNERTLLMLIFGSLLGFGAGIAVVFIRDNVDQRIHLPHDLKKRGYTLLATVGDMRHELKHCGKGPTVSINKRGINKHIITLTSPYSINSEAYRHLRTTLRAGKREQSAQIIMVTSPRLGDGKSTTVANMAVAFAQEKRQVLLVDADLRKPVLHKYLDNSQTPGLSEFLLGNSRDEISIQSTVVNNLHMLSSGKLPPNPSEILGSESMRVFIEYVRERYDYVFLDSSPVLAVTDPCVLASLVNKIVLVIRAGVTGLHELERSVEMLHETSDIEPGIVLNRLNPRFSRGFISRQSGYGNYGYNYGAYPEKDNGRSLIKSE
jgi:tyrosine-protein kinase Etk/Wzc